MIFLRREIIGSMIASSIVSAADPKKKLAGPTQCSNCNYFTSTNTTSGNCRRFPPQFAISNWSFPVVNNSDWCGEFK